MNQPQKATIPQKTTPGGETGVWSNTRGVVYIAWLGSRQTYVYRKDSKVYASGLLSGNLFRLNSMPLTLAMIQAAARPILLCCSTIAQVDSPFSEGYCYRLCKNPAS